MQFELIKEVESIARKEYQCNASLFVEPCLFDLIGDLSFSEKRAVVQARRDGWKILKGQRYIRQTIKFEGEISTVHSRVDMHRICLNHDLYQI